MTVPAVWVGGLKGEAKESVSPNSGTKNGVEVVNWGVTQRRGHGALEAKAPDAPKSAIHSRNRFLGEKTPALLLQEGELIIRGSF